MGEGLYRAGEDNPILFTTEFYNLCVKHKMFDYFDGMRLQNALQSLERKDDKGNTIEGLYNRRPGLNNRTESHDNYVAIVFCSKLLNKPEIAARIDDYGRKNFYSYNNVNPFKFSFMRIRQPYDIMYYRIAAQRCLGLLGFIGLIHLYLSVLLDLIYINHEETSGKLLSWLRFDLMKSKWYIKPALYLWNWKIDKSYSEGIADVFGIYFGFGSELHLLARGIRKCHITF